MTSPDSLTPVVNGAAGEVHAAIDVGTNSFHLVVARVSASGGLEILFRDKEVVRLGSGSGDMRHLTPDAIDRGIEALRGLVKTAASYGADVRAVATSAVREAENRLEFLDRAAAEAGVQVEVISGTEEARLIHLGVVQALSVFDRQILVTDIGGGSTELLIGRGTRPLAVRSVKLGHVRLTDRFFPGGVAAGAAVEECRAYVRSFLTPVGHDLGPYRYELAVGSSGTIATIAQMAEYLRDGRADRWLNNVSFSRAQLAEVTDAVLAAPTPEARRAIGGLDERRADVIVAGVLLLEGVFECFDIPSITVSGYALREGVLLDGVHAGGNGDAFWHLSDIRRESVLRIAEDYDEERPHVRRVTDLALQLFDALGDLHRFGLYERDLLEAAGMLHNVGRFISRGAHHKHSYYVIRSSDRLLGFTEREVELMALVARYQRKALPRMGHAEFAALNVADRARVQLLAGILRIAIALDRTRGGAVSGVTAEAGEALVISCRTAPGADAAVELYTAKQRSELLAAATGLAVRVVAESPVPAGSGSEG
ncbi:MAG: Ppx/GppA family phosphatase [Acidimicrobiia bacterium]|nr:Ppx/GppA family phosphatase [Acidimicrobiia bacterium]MYC45517.1 Ppx/GppA family phosphatase [Acidimicrobiia bacterium]MYI19419.1 Ppx/GppA family phosphatase [Acidimicrobiia bacterium]